MRDVFWTLVAEWKRWEAKTCVISIHKKNQIWEREVQTSPDTWVHMLETFPSFSIWLYLLVWAKRTLLDFCLLFNRSCVWTTNYLLPINRKKMLHFVLKFYVCFYLLCLFVGWTFVIVHMSRWEQSIKTSVLSFHHVGSWGYAQVIRLWILGLTS